jgi:hypothetical protein
MNLSEYRYAPQIGLRLLELLKDWIWLPLSSYCSLLRDDSKESENHWVLDEKLGLQKPILIIDFDADD